LWTSHGSDMAVPTLSNTLRPVRKERTQAQTCSRKSLRWKMWVTCLGLMLLKKPDILKSRSAPALPVALVA
jgi:hypothetical protein